MICETCSTVSNRSLQDGEHIFVLSNGEEHENVYAYSPEQAEAEAKSSWGVRLKCGPEGATKENAARFLAAAQNGSLRIRRYCDPESFIASQ
jgi:hypothetical protein